MFALYLHVLWSHLGLVSIYNRKHPRQYLGVAGACTVAMPQFIPSGTADSELQTAPVAGAKCFNKKIR